MIVLDGGCDKCGKLMQSKAFDPNTGEIDSELRELSTIMICNDCYNRYYSLEALREQKLNKVLRRGLKERIMEWLRL